MKTFSLSLAIAALCAPVLAHENVVDIRRSGDQICISSNGVPDHDMGRFPNAGNPHSFREQSLKYCVDATPQLTGRTEQARGTVGVTISGVPIRPGTADYYDANSPRGFSRDRRSSWNLEGMGARDQLGLDHENAHVDNQGLYHYHGVSPSLAKAAAGTQIGWAADGFQIHYVGASAKPSWQLKSGRRATAPGGRYDGTYNQDFEYVAGSGNLDECNGATVNGQYLYFATDSYPFFPRCLKGTPSKDFVQARAQGDRRRPPPVEAAPDR